MITIEKKTIQLINIGDSKAFARLYKAYYLYLNAIAFYYIHDESTGAEIVNDVFVNIWNKRESLTYPIHSYLTKAVQNGCIDYLRVQRTRELALDNHKEQILSFQEKYIRSTPQPLLYVELRETEHEIKKAVQQLPERCKKVFEKYYFSGQSVEEIAEEMNIQISTVRVQLKNSVDRLRQLLEHILFFVF